MSTRSRRREAILFVFWVASAAIPVGAKANILVFAAASTTDALEDLAGIYNARNDETVRTAFAASSALARQIEAGAPADVFISANTDWMNYLASKGGIVTSTRHPLLGNRLALVAPVGQLFEIEVGPGFPLARNLGRGRLAIGNPDHVPVGIYARAALERLGVWDSIAGRTAPAANARGVLALVERGEATAGIVYATDAGASDRVRVVAEFPADSHPAIVYEAAVVAGRQRAAVRRFLDFLRSRATAAVFARHGFAPAR